MLSAFDKRVIKAKLQITEITLLSREEYNEAKEYIPKLTKCWWLRSPDHFNNFAACIDRYGWIDARLVDCSGTDYVVRPALRAANLIPLGLRKGNQVVGIAGNSWTVISDDLLICNDGIGEHCFRENWEAEDANVYAASDVKKYLEEWAQENGLAIQLEENGKEFEKALAVTEQAISHI